MRCSRGRSGGRTCGATSIRRPTSRGVAPQVVYDEFASKNAMRALVPPEEIADSVVFLASDMARPITGQALYANAGESFH